MIDLDKEHESSIAPLRQQQGDQKDQTDNSSKQSAFAFGGSPAEQNMAANQPKSSLAELTVGALGVALPAITLIVFLVSCYATETTVLLRHPIETLIQAALLINVPLSNFLSWVSYVKNDCRHTQALGIVNGLAISTSFIAVLVSLAAPFSGAVNVDPASAAPGAAAFCIIAAVASAACGVSTYLALKLRGMWQTKGARRRAGIYSIIGAILSLLAVVGSEGRSAMIKYAEHMAVSDSTSEQAAGVNWLRQLDCQRDLNMDCASPNSGGLSGLFQRVDAVNMRQLYFAATGKPFRESKSATEWLEGLPDSYLGTHVVGAPIKGLSLLRSGYTGVLNPLTLTGTVDWTFVFKNKTSSPQEARSEIALPPDAVISGVTLWIDGQPKAASFGVSERAVGSYRWIVVNHRDPALVTHLGRGRILLQAYPVPAQGEMKVRLTFACPLKADDAREASLRLPKFIDNNFAVSGEHSLRLRSDSELTLDLPRIRHAKGDVGEELLIGDLKDEDLKGTSLLIRALRPAGTTISSLDPHNPAQYIVETIKETAASIPRHLVVVLDGSASMKDRLAEVKEALGKVPNEIPSSLLVASDDRKTLEPVPLFEGLKKLDKMSFAGGKDNLQAVLRGAELAGETSGGALLWIHGPQPSFNQEMYIMSPFSAAPAFYEMALDDGWTNLKEFFKNHNEVGPFTSISRNGSLANDLSRFLKHWRNGAREYVAQFQRTSIRPQGTIVSGSAAIEMSSLWANQQCNSLLDKNRMQEAANLGAAYHVITPVTAAVVLERPSDYQQWGLEQPGSTKSWQRQNYFAPKPATVAGNSMAPGWPVAPPAPVAPNTPVLQSTVGAPMPGVNSALAEVAPQNQGATNGTIGPQGADDTFITGINTAGTVRVNNIANLEALLNLMTGYAQMLGLLVGGALLVTATSGAPLRLSRFGIDCTLGRKTRLFLGVSIILLGMAAPGFVNFLVASARDANLFD